MKLTPVWGLGASPFMAYCHCRCLLITVAQKSYNGYQEEAFMVRSLRWVRIPSSEISKLAFGPRKLKAQMSQWQILEGRNARFTPGFSEDRNRGTMSPYAFC